MFGFYTKRFLDAQQDQIDWLRSELQFERDRNGRLQEQFLTLRVGAHIAATAPAVPREDTTPAEITAATKTMDDMRIGEAPE